MDTFSIEGFAAGCKEAMAAQDNRLAAAREYLARTLEHFDRDEIMAALDAAVPPGSGLGEMIVHRSPSLTVLYARVPARFRSGVHNHTVCACIGQLRGEERSVLYERAEDGCGVRATETLSVKEGEVMTLTRDAIHHIENPCDETSAALHLYAGDFAAVMDRRSLWSAEDGREGRFSFEGLLEHSARAMKRDGNEQGLAELVHAIPALEPLVESL